MAPAVTVAIHQPNFFPWLGFFQKLARADIFVLLDHVQLPRKGGAWTNRVKLLIAGAPQWVTAPILRPPGATQSIVDARFDERAPWREKLLKTLTANYRDAQHFQETMELLEPIILHGVSGPADYNTLAIERIQAALGIFNARLVRSSRLFTGGTANDLLIEICRQVGGTAYLCGGGASEYQDDDAFARAGLAVVYQDFRHPSYAQIGAAGDFVQGLSVIDAMMNCGRRGTAQLLVSG
jgi:hypothetical protein